jgi:alpha-tubulin suppressor-like RCC1 family protein
VRLRWVAILTIIAIGAPGAALGEQASEPLVPAAGQLDLGLSFSCAIVTGGQVRCWGYGAEGELGYPGVTTVGATETPASAGPVDLGAGLTATAIAAGDYHTCAIRNDGSVVCWGFGGDGRLGYGNTSNVGDNETPGSMAPVNLGGHAALAITAGGAHTCAILDNHQVACWGFGDLGQLGYASRANVGDTPGETPNVARTVDLGTGRTAVAISAGSSHTCAILDNGSLLCWGYGGNGRLGYGSTDNVGDTETPGSVGPVNLGGHTAAAIAAGGQHTCVILEDRTVRCWGFGFSGQLGYGNQNNAGDHLTPTPDTPDTLPAVNLGGHGAVAITAGSAHTCAILDDGSVECWGYALDGSLGYGNTTNVGDTQTDTPGLIGPVNLGPGRTAVAVSAGQAHTCARLDDGSVRCWGDGANGRLGYCSESNVGDLAANTPDMFGPVNIMPGDGGQLCAAPVPAPAPAPVNASPPSISGQAVAEQTLSEAHGTWSPTPDAYSYQWERCDGTGAKCGSITGATSQSYALTKSDVGTRIRVLETASASGASSSAASSPPTAVIKAASATDPDAGREHGFQSCLAKVGAAASRARALTHRGSKLQRARARRRLARLLNTGRGRCVARYGHTPGRVTNLRAISRGRTKVELDFVVVGTNGNQPPAAQTYLIKQALTPIRTSSDFKRAYALCHGACHFTVQSGGSDTHSGGGAGAMSGACAGGPATAMFRHAARPFASTAGQLQIGMCVSLIITNLKPHTTYHYSIAARDNVTLRPGPRSRTVHATTK